MEGHIARQEPSLSYQLFKSYVRKDWATAATIGSKYTTTYPDEYTAYWLFGRSLAELGKKDDAIKALSVYCEYSKDESWYPEAKALLEKLSN